MTLEPIYKIISLLGLTLISLFVGLFSMVVITFLIYELRVIGHFEEEIVERNQLRAIAFGKIAEDVDAFIAKKNRWPTEEEMYIIGDRHSGTGAGYMGVVRILSEYFAPNQGEKLGPVPPDSYLLSYFDDGYTEYYAAWSKSVNFPITDAQTHLFGSILIHRLIYVLLLCVFLFLVRYLIRDIVKLKNKWIQ